MGRKQDINHGAGMAAAVVAVGVGLATQSAWAGVVTFMALALVLSALRIVR